MPDPSCQPPLTVWSHVWRLILCAAFSGLALSSVAVDLWQDHRGWFWLGVVLGIASFVIVPFRRRQPLAVALLLGVLSTFSGLAAGPSVLAAVSLATRRRYREIALIAVFSIIGSAVYVHIPAGQSEDPFWVSTTANIAATAALLGWGMFIGSRRELVGRLHAEVAQAAAEQELRADQARGAERSRIAREMHDVLAHRISQISMRANAVMFREDLSAEQLREQVGVIQANANEALADLRSVLGVLRDPASGAPLDRPQPTFGDLASLVADEIAAGASVTLTTDVEGDVPELAGRTAYRIVQEALTNSRKHAPGAAVTVAVTGAPRDGLTLLIRNPLGFASSGTPGSGLGLVGLRERAELAGGRLDAGREMSSWAIRGWIPWEK